MINQLSNLINHNRSGSSAKISQDRLYDQVHTSPGQSVLTIHFFIESGPKMIQFNIQFKTKFEIFIQSKIHSKIGLKYSIQNVIQEIGEKQHNDVIFKPSVRACC